MWRLVRSRMSPRRMVPTVLAVVLAVAFVAGVLIFATTVRAAVYDEYARAARNVGVAVTVPSGRLPASTVEEVARTPGVTAVAGRMREPLPVAGPDGRVTTGAAISVGPVPALREFDLRSGRLPVAGDEAAVDEKTAGPVVDVIGADARRHELRVVGVVAIRGDGPTVVMTERGLTALTGATGYRAVVATAAPDTRVEVPGATVRTGERYRSDLARQAFAQVDGLITGLGLFAAVAVLVAGFVIANTFTILVAQRERETALLRCVGAGRGQVLRLVLAESALTGLAGSAAGVLLGVGVAYGLGRLTAGFGLPTGHPLVSPGAVGAALAGGVVVTVAAAWWPARRAARTPPIAALRSLPPRRRRWAWAALPVTLAGVALTAAGPHTGSPQLAMVVVMAGGVLVFGALLLVAPPLISRLVALLGAGPARLGVPVRLAVANARRHPGRTAATTSALIVGVALMAGGSTIAATVSRTADARLAGVSAAARAEQHAIVRQIIAVIAVLLGFALVIALAGMANTLSLSVLERRRESAVVRALGLTRGGLAATLLAEALLMAVAGAVIGVAFGLTYGWLTARAALGATRTLLSVPAGILVAFVAVTVAAAALAALLPARRAARAAVVPALAED